MVVDASGGGSQIGGHSNGGDGGDDSVHDTTAAGDADGGSALHVALECIELWARSDEQLGERLLVGLPGAFTPT